MRPPQINGSDPLRDFGFRRSQISFFCHVPFLPECFTQSHVSSRRSKAPSCFSCSGFGDLKLFSFAFSWSASTHSSRYVSTCPSGSDGPDSLRHSGVELSKCLYPETLIYRHVPLLEINGQDLLQVFGDPTLSVTTISHSIVVDLAPLVPLRNEWSQIASRLWEFGNSTLLCKQRLKLIHFTLDWTTIIPCT
jgi:hypothetical protein